ncbi:MAG: Short chain dehydrogenase [uncultured bacterium]|nr:MAG: Short chain dehydrogenase [uncultured bacterium]KKU25832.1 MAG: hypothetical protein UX37_C0011G0018 [Microgenomates group bacterium GW2011_GWA2_46_16]
MSHDLKNKTVLVTGSTDGLGRLLALELARQGANAIVHGRTVEKTNKIIQELKEINSVGMFSSVVCDLNKPESIHEAFTQVKNLDILVNNAGVWQEGNTIEVDPNKIIEVLNVNLGAPMLVTRTLLPVLLKSSFSQILNTSSIAGVTLPEGYYHTIYTATKWGLQAFTEAMAKEYDGKNLRVMGYYPGGMNTKLFVKGGIDYKEDESWMFDPQESVEALIFMLTRNPKINLKRMDLINHLE